MKTVYIFILACFVALPAAFAQSTEGEPEFLFTNYWPENQEMPSQLQEASQPAIVAAPNPSTGNVLKIWYNQLTQSSDLRVFDVAGRLQHITRVGSERETQGLYKLNVADFAPGVYIVKLTSGLHEVMTKVIIR